MADRIVTIGGDTATVPLSTDGTLAGNSDKQVATEKAVKTYVDTALAGSSPTELDFLDGATAGTVVADKAVVADANKDVGDFRNLDAVNIDAGASGTAGTIDIFPSTEAKGKVAITAADSSGDTTTTIVNASQAGARTYTIPDAGGSASFVMTAGAQTLAGVKTFSSAPVVPDGSFTAAKLANGAGLAALVAAGLGASAAYAKTTAGAQTLAAADPAAARAALIVVVVDETFDNGDGGQTTFTVGETDSADKFAAAALFTGATAGDIFVLAGSLTTNKALLVTGGAATGTGTGGVSVTALLLPAAA